MTFAYPAVLTLLALPVLLMVWEWRRRGTVVALPFDHANARRGRWLEGTVKTANLLVCVLFFIVCLRAYVFDLDRIEAKQYFC